MKAVSAPESAGFYLPHDLRTVSKVTFTIGKYIVLRPILKYLLKSSDLSLNGLLGNVTDSQFRGFC